MCGLERISPACAGNTAIELEGKMDVTDQPRVRGEHAPRKSAIFSLFGSAPRARGTLSSVIAREFLFRISPACAGNTCRTTPANAAAPDQPRVRGEHGAVTESHSVPTGSAPRARGTPAGRRPRRRRHRISPACAGNTLAFRRRHPGAADQPRVRGEHADLDFLRGCRSDQPRVRGEHQNAATRATDQPRVALCVLVDGSAPRARGTRRRPTTGRLPLIARISPACAGNTGE